MIIGFILNGEDVVIDNKANVRLIDILREEFGLIGAKAACLCGKCGNCTVLMNGNVCLACLIPAFKLRGNEIVTIEGFSQTDEYNDIVSGFSQAGLESCGYCTSAKIFITETLLEKNKILDKEEVLKAFNGIQCRCTEPDKLLEGIEKAMEIRQKRLYGR
ncbi:MAG: 2Fe-2S iron-sulfur cluster-binding protein [Treponema sp.]|nr:2Fe-2S iron-sulfur cluster-binding protein [Treponema sp.]